MVAAGHEDQEDQRRVNLSTSAPATKQILQSSDGMISYYELRIGLPKKVSNTNTTLSTFL